MLGLRKCRLRCDVSREGAAVVAAHGRYPADQLQSSSCWHILMLAAVA